VKLGFIQVYNEVDWIGFAIDQALMMCDEILIGEGSMFVSFPDIPARSDDGTLDIISDKRRQYPRKIKTFNLLREDENYRLNMAASFNYALTFCEIGDYFINIDADGFFADKWIIKANELMAENKVDLISVYSNVFAFGFKWRIDFNCGMAVIPKIRKKTKELYFIPNTRHKGTGENQIISSGVNFYHYMWLKPRTRLLIRMRTSGRYPNMVGWFNEYWDKFNLEDGGFYPGYHRDFNLYRYEGDHPSVLDNHPWRHIEDIRKVEK